MSTPLTCPYCTTDTQTILAKLVKGSKLYPERTDLHPYYFWECEDECGAYVGCHRGKGNGQAPLGRLADAKLRAAKGRAHRAFDPLWQKGLMSRTRAYAWLAEKLGIPSEECHIGMFNTSRCDLVVQLCARYRPHKAVPEHRRRSTRLARRKS